MLNNVIKFTRSGITMATTSNSVQEVSYDVLHRVSATSNTPSVLTEIYQDEVNIAIWKNELEQSVLAQANNLLNEVPNLKVVLSVSPKNVYDHLLNHSDELKDKPALCQQISLFVDMFCTLFNLEQVGLRLISLDRPMCPKFHVDKVPCRLVSTFSGCTTQWLEHHVVDRSKLGAGSLGIPDEQSGIMNDASDIQQLSVGDVALLKGENWFANEGGGLVHRSPEPESGGSRLLFTLDFIN